MTALVTGSAGHLGEALMRTLRAAGHAARGIDRKASAFTDATGTIADRAFVSWAMDGVDTVFHTATLHKPHVVTHSRQDFVDTNITGTLNLLEEAAAQGVETFVFTSTTSVFGDAMQPVPGAPAVWLTEDVSPAPKNIYGATKLAAEHLCRLTHRNQKLNCIVLRTSRFFPEEDDDRAQRDAYASDNIKANEFLFRRVDIEDAVGAHLLAAERAPSLGYSCYIVSATTPFKRGDLAELRTDAAAVVRRHVPGYEVEYARRGWRMFPGIDRVYGNARARDELGWRPKTDFAHVVERLQANEPILGSLARTVGAKGYHDEVFADGPYPVA